MGTIYLISVFSIIVFSFIYLETEKITHQLFKIKPLKVATENAKLALDKVSHWTTWLNGIQTAGIASMAFVTKDSFVKCLNDQQKLYAFFVLLFFGSSIILSTWILSSIPSIQQRLVLSDEPKTENDIFELTIFSFVRYTLGRFSGLVHTYFLIGVVFYALFIFSIFQ